MSTPSDSTCDETDLNSSFFSDSSCSDSYFSELSSSSSGESEDEVEATSYMVRRSARFAAITETFSDGPDQHPAHNYDNDELHAEVDTPPNSDDESDTEPYYNEYEDDEDDPEELPLANDQFFSVDEIAERSLDAPWQMVAGGKHKELQEFLAQDRGYNVNKRYGECHGWTLLHFAVYFDLDEVVQALLSREDLDVVAQNEYQCTPLVMAFNSNSERSIAHLLSNPRIDLTDAYAAEALRDLAGNGELWLLRRIVSSGKPLYAEGDIAAANALVNLARAGNNHFTANFLQNHMKSPLASAHSERVGLNITSAMVASVFAQIVFHSDGFLKLPKPREAWVITRAQENARKFFAIAERLPMELQMILANRACGSMKDGVVFSESEMAFRYLGMAYLPTQPENGADSNGRFEWEV